MAFEGMDVGEIQTLGHQLQGQGNTIQTIVSTVDGIANSIEGSWKGPDASQFLSWWQQQHRPALLNAAGAISGLGQSALNNATQQINTSAGSGGTGALAGTVVVGAVAGAATGTSPARPESGSATGGSPDTASPTQLLGKIVTTAQGQHGNGPEQAYLDAAPGASSTEWCGAFTAWVLKQNGLTPPVPDPASVQSWLTAAQHGQDGLSIATNPQAGDVVIYTDPSGNGVHMGILTSAPVDGRFTAISGNFQGEVAATPAGSPYESTTGGTDTYGNSLGDPVFVQVNE